MYRTTLIKITKKGYPTSYIKGVHHNRNNFCNVSLDCLEQCNYVLYETNPKYAHANNAEDIIYKYVLYLGLRGFHLDKTTRKYRKSKQFTSSFDHHKNNTLFCFGRKKKKKKEKVNKMKWISDIDNYTSMLRSEVHHGYKKRYHAYIQNIVVERNKIWMPYILKYLKKKSCFIVCGDGHVDDILLRLLDKGFSTQCVRQGYEIERPSISEESSCYSSNSDFTSTMVESNNDSDSNSSST